MAEIQTGDLPSTSQRLDPWPALSVDNSTEMYIGMIVFTPLRFTPLFNFKSLIHHDWKGLWWLYSKLE
jgi:hypothetical protein